jgi:hypothetical protein
MSTTNPSNWIDEETTTVRAAARAATRLGSTAVRPVRALAFWLAVVLPFAYLSLLVGGIGTDSELFTFAGLVAANAVALLVGHDHHR